MKLTLALAATVAATLVGLPAQAAPGSSAPVEALVRGDLPTGYVQYRRFGHRRRRNRHLRVSPVPTMGRPVPSQDRRGAALARR